MTRKVPEPLPPARDDFLTAMAKVASPVALITTGTLQRPVGLTATATCSLSADPPSVLICINKSASTHDELLRHQTFAVNFLLADQGDVAARFARKDVDRFAGETWTAMATGAPVLQSAGVALDCRLHAAIDAFSHSILIGTVISILTNEDEQNPSLVWHQRRFCRTAEI